jgi:hypothetical protein
MHSDTGLFGEPYRNGSPQEDASVSSLPRRDPGASGILGTPEPAAEPAADQHEPDRPQEAAETRTPADTSAFFSSRSQAANGASARPDRAEDIDVIFQRLVSEWLIDPMTLLQPLQSWESVWDSGWAAAEQADEAPVTAHTEQGLPMREPGARLIPGRANGAAHRKPDGDNEVASAAREPVRRDPDAVRASLSSHWGGVRAGRSHARESGPEDG